VKVVVGASGVGALILIGLGQWSGLGDFSLAVPGLAHFARPDVAEFGWALVIGLAAALLAMSLHRGAVLMRGIVQRQPSYGIGALVLLVAMKSIAYAVSMSGFRGGPVFPAIFVGAVGGALLSHLPGLPLVPAVGMGIGAMLVGMLRLPLTSVLLASLLLFSDGVANMPVVIVAVVTAYVAVTWLDPPAPPEPAGSAPPPSPAPSAAG
jgi:H+/Cl- antiporter ClcA